MIYHYTSIDTLELILKHKTFRFTRLDHVDDPEEYQFKRDGINPAQYVFVSCWSSIRKENMPQWLLYANKGHGIRIGLEEPLFDFTYDQERNLYNFKMPKLPDLYVLPYFSSKSFPVNYVVDVAEMTDMVFSQLARPEDPEIDFGALGLYKSLEWAFLSERRFRIIAFPKNENGCVINNFIDQKIPISRDYIDVPMKDNSLTTLEITYGPHMTNAERKKADDILDTYVPKAQRMPSVFLKE